MMMWSSSLGQKQKQKRQNVIVFVFVFVILISYVSRVCLGGLGAGKGR